LWKQPELLITYQKGLETALYIYTITSQPLRFDDCNKPYNILKTMQCQFIIKILATGEYTISAPIFTRISRFHCPADGGVSSCSAFRSNPCL